MSRFRLGTQARIESAASKTGIQLLGNPLSALTVVVLAIVTGIGTARYVAMTERYLAIQYALPTYDGSIAAFFYVGGGILLGLAVMSALLKAGLVPSVLLASAPVVGWAVNHFASPISPPYAVTFPIEMAILYGGLFGTTGYLLGTLIRRGADHAT